MDETPDPVPARDRDRQVVTIAAAPSRHGPAAGRPGAPPGPGGLAYQPFVDGLRAVAILAVVLYHVGVPGFPGGFIGVDVFFVISGYLIIGQIVSGLQSGRFSFAEFWARRVLRILPPFLLVIVAGLAVAPLILATPDEYASLGAEAEYAALMVVNHYFLAHQGYFDTAAALKPLLHLWTLAVEEQFYLVAPVALFLLFAAGRLWPGARRPFWAAATGGVLVASFIGCVVLTTADENFAFYLMPLRAWEFVAGGLAGFAPVFLAGRGRMTIELLAVAGMAAILIAIVGLDDARPYPSWFAALPALGTATVIAAGLVLPRGVIARGLAAPVMVGIGLVSYAWYLWHWPLLAFTRIFNLGDRDLVFDGATAVVAFGLAVATHLFLERPIKRWRRRPLTGPTGWRIVVAGVAACGLVAIAGGTIATVVPPAIAARIPASMLPASPFTSLADEPCALDGNMALSPACVSAAGGATFGLLFGDSHARAAFRTLRDKAHAAGARLIVDWGSGCPPLLDTTVFRDGAPYTECVADIARGLANVEAALPGKLDFVIFDARWNLHVGSPRTDPSDEPLRQIGMPGAGRPAADQYATLADRLRSTIGRLKAAGVKRILLMAPEPEFTHYAPDCVLHADRYGESRDVCGLPRSAVEARRAPTVAALKAAVAGLDDVRLIDPLDLFCDRQTCRPYDGNVLLYADDDHLAPAGIERIYAAFAPDFAWVFGTTKSVAAP